MLWFVKLVSGGGPRVVVSTAAFHARVRGSVPGLGGLKETKLFLPHPRVKVSIVGSLRDREVACSASDRQGSNFESCVWRTVSSQSSHHPQEVLLAQFSLYVHKGGLKPDSFHFCQASLRVRGCQLIFLVCVMRLSYFHCLHLTVLQLLVLLCSFALDWAACWYSNSKVKEADHNSLLQFNLLTSSLPDDKVLPNDGMPESEFRSYRRPRNFEFLSSDVSKLRRS